MTCTFFGHRDTQADVEERLKDVLTELITEKEVTTFWVGNEGNFDRMVRRVIQELSVNFPHVRYAVVLAYRPLNRPGDTEYGDTVYPQELANVPLRAAIPARNAWMLAHAEYVVTYVCRHGSAVQWQREAEKSGKTVLRLADEPYCL